MVRDPGKDVAILGRGPEEVTGAWGRGCSLASGRPEGPPCAMEPQTPGRAPSWRVPSDHRLSGLGFPAVTFPAGSSPVTGNDPEPQSEPPACL